MLHTRHSIIWVMSKQPNLISPPSFMATRGIIFFGSPHKGSSMTILANLVASVEQLTVRSTDRNLVWDLRPQASGGIDKFSIESGIVFADYWAGEHSLCASKWYAMNMATLFLSLLSSPSCVGAACWSATLSRAVQGILGERGRFCRLGSDSLLHAFQS
jgi:hypothetical protein